ncbi:MAG: chemoreceptor glutamine deamidase CheD [Alphaproteobacteria bacterium]|nr:MAG: chemoreceptor glutamine deamidase CheD [Alphaproteobacteria bacterium]
MTNPRAVWDGKINAMTITVLPGRHEVLSERDIALVTLLGSCVAACIRDPRLGLGGLNHFLLPGDDSNGDGSARYGVNAMELLINDILRRGGKKSRLEAKVFGGANVIDVNSSQTVGNRNASFVLEFLKREGIPVLAQDLGGQRGRRIFYFPSTGRASVLMLRETETRRVNRNELPLIKTPNPASRAGAVELF